MTNRELYNAIQNILQIKGINLSELAEMAGVSRTNLSAILNSEEEYDLPTGVRSVLGKIAYAYPSFFGNISSKKSEQLEEDDRKRADQLYETQFNKIIEAIKGSSLKTSGQRSDDILLEILINQKATLQYLREIDRKLDNGHFLNKDKSLDEEVQEAVRKDKATGKGKQSNRGA